MIVVGGTYHERCLVPEHNVLRGSGLRAAVALRELVGDLTLMSSIDADGQEHAALVAGAFDLSAEWVARTEAVRFTYFTPLSPPSIDGRLSRAEARIEASDSTILVFGMLEAPWNILSVRAERLVLDPQQPRDLTSLDLSSFEYVQLAIVANAAETRALGRDTDVRVAARQLFETYGATVLVTKMGAYGAIVTTASAQESIGPFPTASVWPIGCGDVFAAAFSWAWGMEGMVPRDAARFASSSVGKWSVCRELEPPLPASMGSHGDELPQPAQPPRVYLAGPFFDLGQRWLVELVRDALTELGSQVFSPLHDVGLGNAEVAAQDLAGLEVSEVILALLDGGDAGTLFEVGYATAIGIPVVGYAAFPDREALKMLAGTGAEVQEDISTAVYRAIWKGMERMNGRHE